jgi:type I restriction enzyme R subunit/putative DNA methylase
MKNPGSDEHQLGPEKEKKAEPQLGSEKEKKAEPGLGAPGVPGPDSPSYWRSRGYLPHFETREKMQSITFRLADSLPQSKLDELRQELTVLPHEKQVFERRKRIETWLDAGMGCCALRHPAVAQVVQDTLLRFDGERYRLIAWCIMPNHVHVLIRPETELSRIVQSWKSYTGRWALERNAELGLGVPGKAFWMREYWDRFIRDEKHFAAVVEYIHNNPVKAELCSTAEEWQWSSLGAPSAGSA